MAYCQVIGQLEGVLLKLLIGTWYFNIWSCFELYMHDVDYFVGCLNRSALKLRFRSGSCVSVSECLGFVYGNYAASSQLGLPSSRNFVLCLEVNLLLPLHCLEALQRFNAVSFQWLGPQHGMTFLQICVLF